MILREGSAAVKAGELPAGNQRPRNPGISPSVTIKTCTLIGAAGFLLLTVLELADLNWRLGFLVSASDRFLLLLFSSINILVGAVVGFLTGISIVLLSGITGIVEKALGRLRPPGWLSSAAAVVFTAGIAAICLNPFSRVNRFVIGMIREFEKIRFLRDTLLNHERSTTYLLLMSIVLVCALLVILVRASARMNRAVWILWVAALAAAILFIYRTDSRVEVQLYEFTMHRSLYVAGVILAMALAASIAGPSSTISKVWQRQTGTRRRVISVFAIVVFVASITFTFLRFGTNQSIKTQVFLRSTQAKQNFQLVWWALDRDRDGYSALLDGGDASDANAEINPGISERVGDGIDNNGLGGDLTEQDLSDWRTRHTALHPVPSAVTRPVNIIFFFIDTVRADHLSAYGYHRKTTPNLDRLAERSVVFENGFSPAARTAEAIPRFMQSSYWDAGIESWTQVLARNNYTVGLFPGRRSWDRYNRMMRAVPGAQGKTLEENIDFVIKTLGERDTSQAFCDFVYVPDPHLPYIRHAEFDFGSSATDLYDGELAYTDSQIGRLLDWLERTGRLKDTMIVVMSDHGESLGERDVYRHASQLYNEQTHVPMIIYHPEIAPRRVSDYVSTIDLGSTILSANGVTCPQEYTGVSLLPLMKGEPFRRPPVYAELTKEEVSQYVMLDQQVHPEWKKYMAVSQDGFKIIFARDVFTFELYDLKKDPKEERNLYSVMPAKADEMKKLVLQYVDIVTASRPATADEGRYSKAGGADGDKVED
jgi:glucan phosphoethanolaminetransferase (alkaline phosphatase superfamily)